MTSGDNIFTFVYTIEPLKDIFVYVIIEFQDKFVPVNLNSSIIYTTQCLCKNTVKNGNFKVITGINTAKNLVGIPVLHSDRNFNILIPYLMKFQLKTKMFIPHIYIRNIGISSVKNQLKSYLKISVMTR